MTGPHRCVHFFFFCFFERMVVMPTFQRSRPILSRVSVADAWSLFRFRSVCNVWWTYLRFLLHSHRVCRTVFGYAAFFLHFSRSESRVPTSGPLGAISRAFGVGSRLVLALEVRIGIGIMGGGLVTMRMYVQAASQRKPIRRRRLLFS